MVKNNTRNKWHDLDKLESVLINLKEDDAYQLNFTSLDRIIELQQLFSIIKTNLIHYAFEDGDEIHCIKDELQTFRGFLSNLVQEWESCISEIDWIAKNLVSSTKKEYSLKTEIRSYEQLTNESDENILKSSTAEVANNSIHVENILTSNIDINIVMPKRIGNVYKPTIQLSKEEQALFEILLSQISQNPDLKLTDTRGMPNGELFISLYKSPNDIAKKTLKRLVSLGLQIWPGKHFLFD